MEATNLASSCQLPLLDWARIGDGLRAELTQAPDTGAPSAGPPPWHVYRLTPKTVTTLTTVDPGGATRWRF